MTQVKNIFIVDDDTEDSEFFTTVIGQINPAITVTEANNLKELFAHLAQSVPDLLFIDSFLQQDSGQETIKKLRDNPSFAALPVIMYTGSSDDKSIRAAFEAGASSYIVKPNSLVEIKTVLQTVLTTNWRAGAGAQKQVYADRQFKNFEL